MTQDELIADTNRLLRELLAADEERRKEGERAREQLDSSLEEMKSNTLSTRAASLIEKGIPAEEAGMTDEEQKRRHTEAQASMKEKLEARRKVTEEYNAELLDELRKQSELLRQISEKLSR